jgi:sRNA-binding carbon storage regulator CsrA
MLNENIPIICPKKHMIKNNGEYAKINDNIKFKILKIDNHKLRLLVSHSKTF